MKWKNNILPLLLISLSTVWQTVNGQDIHFSQFFESPVWRNPSLAGIFTGDIRVQSVYRDQWNSVTNAYRTGSFNAERKLPIGNNNDFITGGLQLMFDRAGTIGWTTTQVLPVLNYHKSLSSERNMYLSAGFMGGWVQRRFDPSKVTTNNTYDNGGSGENFTNTQFNYLDGSAGLSFNADIGNNPENNYFLGAAYHHFNRPQNSFYRDPGIQLQPKWVFSGGLRFGVSDYSYITLLADHSRQGNYQETVAGTLIGLKLGSDPDQPTYTFHAGGFLRWNDALIPVIKLDYTPFSISFSYDVNVSKLRPSTFGRGGFEISISYIGISPDKSSLDLLRCPKF